MSDTIYSVIQKDAELVRKCDKTIEARLKFVATRNKTFNIYSEIIRIDIEINNLNDLINNKSKVKNAKHKAELDELKYQRDALKEDYLASLYEQKAYEENYRSFHNVYKAGIKDLIADLHNSGRANYIKKLYEKSERYLNTVIPILHSDFSFPEHI